MRAQVYLVCSLCWCRSWILLPALADSLRLQGCAAGCMTAADTARSARKRWLAHRSLASPALQAMGDARAAEYMRAACCCTFFSSVFLPAGDGRRSVG